ncbi:chemotaxis protein CheD [Desulfocurvibacter africanus]|uniref:Probable chemoreceptor glutamine deamidase CheD n=1 Tax=Desulfocurvibacter africanus subsp. africanus str. Walvis Bay TaxID=690850 RepID=F3Z281_DESAF|nr:chemotaxis protein CheD [Desulfocurvibacter africanus]EGJ51290.1 CheD [Desulfocurvibacter africanus subsp. africanus str. Walvis Bay]
MHVNKAWDTAGPRQLMDSGVNHIHLLIGECIVSGHDLLISTVLGSCVSATFHHPATRLSAMFHAMLPTGDMDSRQVLACKYVDGAVKLIADKYTARRIDLSKVQVKLFGGGFTVSRREKEVLRDIVDVGGMNVEQARRELVRHGFAILREDVLGLKGRKLYFHTASGAAWMKLLPGGQAFSNWVS